MKFLIKVARFVLIALIIFLTTTIAGSCIASAFIASLVGWIFGFFVSLTVCVFIELLAGCETLEEEDKKEE